MAMKGAFIVLVLSLVISTVLCQTFQYSRGWTNGKRSEFPNSLGVSNPGDERFVNGELKRLKMLVYGNVDEQVSFRTVLKFISLNIDCTSTFTPFFLSLLRKRKEIKRRCHISSPDLQILDSFEK